MNVTDFRRKPEPQRASNYPCAYCWPRFIPASHWDADAKPCCDCCERHADHKRKPHQPDCAFVEIA